MKEMMFAFTIVFLLASCLSNKEANEKKENTKAVSTYAVGDKKVKVYSTADTANLRMTLTEILGFSDFGQPLETQVCVVGHGFKATKTNDQ